MWPNQQETEDLVTFTEEVLNRKLYFLCSGHNCLKKSFFKTQGKASKMPKNLICNKSFLFNRDIRFFKMLFFITRFIWVLSNICLMFNCLKRFILMIKGWVLISYDRVQVLKSSFHLQRFKMLLMEACTLIIYDIIIQKTMSPRKSEEEVMIKFCKS